jgi:hypothetical protein
VAAALALMGCNLITTADSLTIAEGDEAKSPASTGSGTNTNTGGAGGTTGNGGAGATGAGPGAEVRAARSTPWWPPMASASATS